MVYSTEWKGEGTRFEQSNEMDSEGGDYDDAASDRPVVVVEPNSLSDAVAVRKLRQSDKTVVLFNPDRNLVIADETVFFMEPFEARGASGGEKFLVVGGEDCDIFWKRGGERYEKIGQVKDPWNVNDIFKIITQALS